MVEVDCCCCGPDYFLLKTESSFALARSVRPSVVASHCFGLREYDEVAYVGLVWMRKGLEIESKEK
jgi:hypothetical protein